MGILKVRSVIADTRTTAVPTTMQTPRRPTSRAYLSLAVTVLAAVILAGCGASSPNSQVASASVPPSSPDDGAESALLRLTAPPGFRLTSCTFLPKRAHTRCYRRNTAVHLTPARFTALLTAAGLKPVPSTVACPRFIRARPDTSVTRDSCQARARVASVEFAAFATSIKIHRSALKPSDRKLAAKLAGTSFEVTSATASAPHA
jgi:hypothetical protein